MERLKMLKTVEKTNLNINYWKEIQGELPDILNNLSGIVLLTHNSVEFTDIIDFLKNIRKEEFMNVLYISLVRSYDYMKNALSLKQLDQKRMMFIDCVSGYAFPQEENIDNCLYHKPPQNLEEMKQIITFGIDKSGPDMIVIDSLSQFINFTRPTEYEIRELYKFLQSLRTSSLNIIQNTFILLYDTKLGVMQNLPKFSTDLILKVEKVKEETRWID